MGLDLAIVGKRTIRFTRPDGSEGTETQEVHFDDVLNCNEQQTLQIVGAENPLEQYIDLVRKVAAECFSMVKVYAEDDEFCEREPIGEEPDTWGPEHEASIHAWIRAVEQRGFTVKFVAW